MRDCLHPLLTLHGEATEGQEAVRETADHLQPGLDLGIGQVRSELNVLIQASISVRLNKQGGREVLENLLLSHQGRQQKIILTCTKLQLLLKRPRTRELKFM